MSHPEQPIEVKAMSASETGLAHIAAAFSATKAQGRAALMPYYTLGYPDLPTSVTVVRAIAGAGADLIELGVPFSDPLADGPTVQHSTQVALEHGATLARCLELAAQLRREGVTQPLLFMGYYNPILDYGIERFASDAAGAGVDGFIVPDLPVEEASQLEAAAVQHGRALVFLLAPTSPPQRVAAVAKHGAGFSYLVSLTGVTGARDALPPGLTDFIARVRAVVRTPIAVGFGIATPEMARAVGQLADGVIVGSALINAVRAGQDPAAAAAEFVNALRAALEG
jgi:tryptophan synthase alpha chain